MNPISSSTGEHWVGEWIEHKKYGLRKSYQRRSDRHPKDFSILELTLIKICDNLGPPEKWGVKGGVYTKEKSPVCRERFQKFDIMLRMIKTNSEF